jgi:hypothetical protein
MILLRKTDCPLKWAIYFIFQNGRREGFRPLLARQRVLCPNSVSKTARTASNDLSYLFVDHELDQSPRSREEISMRLSGSALLLDDRNHDPIAEELEISPFHSVHSLASAIKRLRETVWCHLHSIGFVVKHLRLVPHTLSLVQTNKRIEYSLDLKRTLK